MKKIYSLTLLILTSCSSFLSSVKKEDQIDVALHELKSEIMDLKQSMDSCQVELQMLDEKLQIEHSLVQNLKNQSFNLQQSKIDSLNQDLTAIEKRIASLDFTQKKVVTDFKQVSDHSNDIISAVTQCQGRIQDIESKIKNQHDRLDEVYKLKSTLQSISKAISQQKSKNEDYQIHKVQRGESLGKIAKDYQTTIKAIKDLNSIEGDQILIGNELKIPMPQ